MDTEKLGASCACVVDPDPDGEFPGGWVPCPYQMCEREDHFHDAELAWAAGFFDGEGCVSACRKSDRLAYITMTVNQYSNRRVVDRFRDAVGEGNVRGPDKRGDYRWQVTGRVASRAMERLRPYLTEQSPKVSKYCRLKDAGVR